MYNIYYIYCSMLTDILNLIVPTGNKPKKWFHLYVAGSESNKQTEI